MSAIYRGISKHINIFFLVPVLLFTMFAGNVASAAESAGESTEPNDAIYWGICFLGAMVALVQAYLFFRSMMASEEGDERMIELAEHVREGAQAYLTQQYKVVI